MHQQGLSLKEIEEKMKLKESLVRVYIWRAKNPKKYKRIVKRWYEKRKSKFEEAEEE